MTRRSAALSVRARLGLLALALVAGSPALQGTEIEVGMAPQQITVGDPVVVEINVTPPAGSQRPIFPDWATGTWGRAEILEVGEVQQSPAGPGQNRYTQRLLLTAFEVGPIELPPITIELPRTSADRPSIRSDAYLLDVVSVIPAETDATAAEPRPPAALRELDSGRVFWWLVGLLALAGAVLTAILLRSAPGEAFARPHLDPLDEFDQLVRELGAEADPIAFHTRLSFALRRFLGRALGFGATESTTTEIQQRLRQHQLTGETVRHTSQLLRDCDQVKFARILAERRTHDETLGEAGRLARTVYRDVRPDDAETPTAHDGKPPSPNLQTQGGTR